MATNPNNAVGTNGAFGGRTSVNAFNDVLSVFNGRGIIQGWDMAPNEGMIINIGGDGTTRDVAVAEDNIGNKTTINNISEEPIALTIPAAPAASSRIDAVVAYVDNPAQGSATETDNPAACGLIVVEGTVATTPTAPDEEAIRTAITADGGAGTVAYYVVLGTVTVASGTTDISANMLTKGGYAAVKSDNVDCAYSTDEQRVGTWLDGSDIYSRTVFFSGTTTANTRLLINLWQDVLINRLVDVGGSLISDSGNVTLPIGVPWIASSGGVTGLNMISSIVIDGSGNPVLHVTSVYSAGVRGWATLYYTKR